MDETASGTAQDPDFTVLAIETSCDETAAAILAADGRVLAEAVLSQTDHAAFGGVVPEIAARAHLHHLPRLVRQVLAEAGLAPPGLGAVAATVGPGLIGGLIVGSGLAKGMAVALGRPFVAVNHLEAHALTARLPGLTPGGAPFPYLLLLVSGGHCQLVLVDGVGRYRLLGGTIDDAVGEAFDKVAKMLGLGWPGGPALERLAAEGRPVHALPRPMLGRNGCDFSFSGLKTAVAQLLSAQSPAQSLAQTPAQAPAQALAAATPAFPQGQAYIPPRDALPRQAAADIAASFQAAVVDVLVDRVGHAIGQAAALAPDCRLLVVAGGVAANGPIRAALGRLAEARGLALSAPPLRLCGDNAVMVAWAAIERLRVGAAMGLDTPARPRWPLADLAPADLAPADLATAGLATAGLATAARGTTAPQGAPQGSP